MATYQTYKIEGSSYGLSLGLNLNQSTLSFEPWQTLGKVVISILLMWTVFKITEGCQLAPSLITTSPFQIDSVTLSKNCNGNGGMEMIFQWRPRNVRMFQTMARVNRKSGISKFEVNKGNAAM